MTRADLVLAARDDDTELIAALRRQHEADRAAWARELAAAQEHAANLEGVVAGLRTEVERMRLVFDAAVAWATKDDVGIGAILDAVADLEDG